MSHPDFVIIGAGHNALVCAGYLAKAGYRVHVIERRPIVGGAVVTEEIVPGFKFDLGGSAHILINHTPIVRDLGLEQHGLEYIDLDPLFCIGSSNDVIARLREYIDAGASKFVLFPIAAGERDAVEQTRRIIDEVMPVIEN